MRNPGSVTRLAQQLHAGNQAAHDEAARQLWERYASELLNLARRKLQQGIRRREDEHDVMQSMYETFCRRQRRGDFEFNTRDELWALLVSITIRKARNLVARQSSAKRNYHREQPDNLDGYTPASDGIHAGPTPAEAAQLNEELEKRLGLLQEDELVRIAHWKLEGYTHEEIAAMMRRTVRTVERKVNRIKSIWLEYDSTSATGNH